MEPKDISAANIKKLREHARLTQTEFAELHDCTQKRLWGYEKGKFFPSTEFLLSVSRQYGFEPEMLYKIIFKLDAAGKITNLPKSSNDIREVKEEVKSLMTDLNGMIKRLEELHKRLQILETKGVGGLTKKLTTGKK